MGQRTEQVKGRLGAVRKATDEARAAFLSAEDRLAEIEDREARRQDRQERAVKR